MWLNDLFTNVIWLSNGTCQGRTRVIVEKKKTLTGNILPLFVAGASSKLLRRKITPFSIVTVK